MQAGKRYSIIDTLNWTRRPILLFLIWDSIPIVLFQVFGIDWVRVPWQPLSLIGIAVAFYLGFKNNSSYERLWEGRKIWGGIVNASRSFTVIIVNWVNNDEANQKLSDEELLSIKKRLVHRHVAWLRTLSIELRKLKKWEHTGSKNEKIRELMGTTYSEKKFEEIKPYISEDEFNYVMSKGNRSSHILSIQTKDLTELRQAGIIEHFRHLEMQSHITEFYALQGKSERIKNFPFPRQYATINYFFVMLFVLIIPFGMLDVFDGWDQQLIWLCIPFSVISSWVYWTMELTGDYSENPFEGLFNDVPITALSRGIEIDIRQMLEETDLPDPIGTYGSHDIQP